MHQPLSSTDVHKVGSSVHTEITACESADMLNPSDTKTMRRPRVKGSRSAGKDYLVGLIAQEVTNSWTVGDDEGGSAELTPSNLSAEELFYAQINGEALVEASSTSGSAASLSTAHFEPANLPREEGREQTDDDDDDCSFLDLKFPEDVMDASPPRTSPIEQAAPKSRKSKQSKGSKTKKSDQSKSSNASETSGEDTVSVDEIQQIVMNSIPDDVKDKIPKEAWAQIFGASAPDKTRRPSKVLVNPEDETDVTTQDQEESSVVSDITEFTTAPKYPEKMISLDPAHGADRWDEQLCPGLDKKPLINRTSDLSADTSTSESLSQECASRVSYRTDPSGEVIASRRNGVSFSFVQVRYYDRILEINPAVTNGAAIGIGWKYKRGGKMAVDDWEVHRGAKLRSSQDLLLPKHIREGMLKDLGYTQKQIAEATRIIRKAKDRRRITVQNTSASTQAMEEKVEAASRKIKGLLSFGRKKGLVSNY